VHVKINLFINNMKLASSRSLHLYITSIDLADMTCFEF